jgi:hypothetical protein
MNCWVDYKYLPCLRCSSLLNSLWPDRKPQQSSQDEQRTRGSRHKGTQKGENPGPKNQPPCESPPGTPVKHLLLRWPAMRAHPSWQRPLKMSHLISLFFSSPLFFPSILFCSALLIQRVILHASPYLAFKPRHRSQGATSLRSNNYRTPSIMRLEGATQSSGMKRPVQATK